MTRKLLKSVAVLWVLVLLTACGAGQQNTRPSSDAAKRNGLELYQAQNYFAATEWLTQAWDNNPNDPEVLVALLDSWLQLGESLPIWKLLHETPLETPETRVIQAELSQLNGQCEQALSMTADIGIEALLAFWQPRYWQLQATCQEQQRAYFAAALAWIAVAELTPENEPVGVVPEAITDTKPDQMPGLQGIHDRIVRNLLQVDDAALILALGDPQYSPTAQGWIEAAYVNFGADGVSGQNWLMQWSDHPASQYFLDLNRINRKQTVAVLLPFSGRFADVAKAIQTGLLTAATSDFGNQNKLVFYDTGSQGENLAASWFSAQENGSDLIIGPLDKTSIEAAVKLPAATMPVVLLNQAESPYFQFTLSPEGEAVQVAKRMIQDGHKRVLILALNEPWGERMTQAFAQAFYDLGGQIIDNSYYQAEQNDYSAQLRQTLGLVESQLRARNLQQFLKLNLAAEEVVRSDVDAIFLAARPSFARLMVPQLKFHHAAGLPVYATSHVFAGLLNEQHNRDLQNLRFAVSPIELQSSRLSETLPFSLQRVQTDAKLFAFGFDAYQLIARLEWMSRVNTGIIEGLSGRISLGFDGDFDRELEWAQYIDGSVIALPK
ncbi:penicillin-binding protein activator [Marinicella meishanensis]|uniref:penicillin-binding protein activator n=1 Tax=Marinicella meishanensis TaxID=2873263 RepID=UPI001CC0D68D|nr:penicillin-binding protein activator [Marinicella sp. NBU2979]